MSRENGRCLTHGFLVINHWQIRWEFGRPWRGTMAQVVTLLCIQGFWESLRFRFSSPKLGSSRIRGNRPKSPQHRCAAVNYDQIHKENISIEWYWVKRDEEVSSYLLLVEHDDWNVTQEITQIQGFWRPYQEAEFWRRAGFHCTGCAGRIQRSGGKRVNPSIRGSFLGDFVTVQMFETDKLNVST